MTNSRARNAAFSADLGIACQGADGNRPAAPAWTMSHSPLNFKMNDRIFVVIGLRPRCNIITGCRRASALRIDCLTTNDGSSYRTGTGGFAGILPHLRRITANNGHVNDGDLRQLQCAA
jgi:hypothetical protein